MMFSLVIDTTREEKSPRHLKVRCYITWHDGQEYIGPMISRDIKKQVPRDHEMQRWDRHREGLSVCTSSKADNSGPGFPPPVAGWPDKSPGTRFSLCTNVYFIHITDQKICVSYYVRPGL